MIDALNGQLIGEIAAGGSASIEIVIENEVYLSTASMLVATNDSFVGLNSVILWNEDHSPIESQTIELNAYDAGTEAQHRARQRLRRRPARPVTRRREPRQRRSHE